ncbi:hypothetical protein ACMXYR_15140 [Neptuniibacter sp. QD29_5]|uniref:hypothetical protein n=1 Tax=Neptuniibacter sp. QD29_5 TaxID=3398207 RepID=UPI0039F5ADB0
MNIWREMQEKELILQGCLMSSGSIKKSTFPEEYKKQLAAARQALLYIFKSAAQHSEGYDEAHMEVGYHHYSGYQLDANTILICFCDSDARQHYLREFIDENKQRFLALLST